MGQQRNRGAASGMAFCFFLLAGGFALGSEDSRRAAVERYLGFAQAARDGAIQNAEVSVDAGAGADYGTPFALPASPAYAVVSRHLGQNPNGGGSWTVPAVNSLQVGIRFTI